jgi:hypothetical protein
MYVLELQNLEPLGRLAAAGCLLTAVAFGTAIDKRGPLE